MVMGMLIMQVWIKGDDKGEKVYWNRKKRGRKEEVGVDREGVEGGVGRLGFEMPDM
jgi:hypothetical protein